MSETTSIVIFGATGDLTRRKLVPALYNLYRKDEHEDYIYGQRRERKIGLFRFAPGEHSLRLVCIGANPLSRNPETGKPGYNLTADVLSLRLLPFGDTDAWIEKMLEMKKKQEHGR